MVPNIYWSRIFKDSHICRLLTKNGRKGAPDCLSCRSSKRDRAMADLAKLIESRSAGALSFHVTTIYPLLARLEERGLVTGKWEERPEQRRRRYYSLTTKGRKTLAIQ